MIAKYDESLMVDRILTGQNYFKESMAGVVINEVPRPQLEHVVDSIVPFLQRHNIQVFGVIRKEQLLAAPSVRELSEGLQAELLCAESCFDELVEHFLVGAMSADSALSYFRQTRTPIKIRGIRQERPAQPSFMSLI
jgi:BioD-like phosphotransacetylase family protein